MKIGAALSLFALLWCAAVVVKVAVVVGRREPYRFTQWDGGLMFRGKEVRGTGTAAFAAFAVVCGAIAAYQLVRWMPYL
jgi:hypothetical protein